MGLAGKGWGPPGRAPAPPLTPALLCQEKKVKDPNAPKRALAAYMYFCKVRGAAGRATNWPAGLSLGQLREPPLPRLPRQPHTCLTDARPSRTSARW